jgi:hypothetical protein
MQEGSETSDLTTTRISALEPGLALFRREARSVRADTISKLSISAAVDQSAPARAGMSRSPAGAQPLGHLTSPTEAATRAEHVERRFKVIQASLCGNSRIHAGPGGILAGLRAGRPSSRDIRKMAAINAARPASVVTGIQERAQLTG